MNINWNLLKCTFPSCWSKSCKVCSPPIYLFVGVEFRVSNVEFFSSSGHCQKLLQVINILISARIGNLLCKPNVTCIYISAKTPGIFQYILFLGVFF
ncbi:hypothetical protein GIB67_006984 [Kingdonia uniflora]|uniref:Uncharacterized protein n=1 Tax=Kingdonia uniflora TaxID=39325 RepID=A0A7J7NZ55_9MAGN|nr:hypothetical protein GIB67_006984 [Kingdonia uniflora]